MLTPDAKAARPIRWPSGEPSLRDTVRDTGGPGPTVRERLRVLHVFNHLGTGGTEYGVLRVASGLDSALFEHRLCTIRGFDPQLVHGRDLADKLYVAGKLGAARQFPLFRLIRIMKEYRPHIVHSRNWGGAEAILAARMTGVPVTIHSEHGYEVEMLTGLLTRRRLLRRALYALADAVFAVTSELRDFHARQAWVSSGRIRVIYNGVDTKQFSVQPEIGLRVREEFGWLAETFVVGTVGRAVPIKDQGTLLKAAEILIRMGLDVRVLLVGSGPQLNTLQEYAEASPELAGHTRFAGSSERVADLLNAMDVFVLPSLCEGMSNTLLEAMACGVPVVATRVGGNPELVEEGRSGWLFTPGNVEELAQLLRRLACEGERRQRMGRAGRERVLEQFRLEGMLKRYQQLYLELAQAHNLLVRS